MPRADRVVPDEVQDQRLPRTEFRPDIEGLRAVAVVAVVLFHADIPGVSGGFVGVDVFFVISGFLITGLLWREVSTTGTVGLRRFYGARARRLLPASATVGVAIMVGAAVLLPLLQARSVLRDGIASALYVSNFWFALQGVDYLAASGPPSPFQHYWSLAVEEQFYLLWPAMIIGTVWLIRRARRGSRAEAPLSEGPYVVVLALVAVSSFVTSLIVTYVAPPLAFFSLPTRAWELAIGGLVALTALLWRRLTPLVAAVTGWAGLAVILMACTQLSPASRYPGTAALLPALGTALVLSAGCKLPSRGCGRLLATSPMRSVGRMSYSWYLWHWPLLGVALWSMAPILGHSLLLGLSAVLISAGLAVLTLRFIENPLRFSAPLRSSPSRSLALGGIATSIAVAVGTSLLLIWVPTPIGRGPAERPLTVTLTPPRFGSAADAYEAAVRQGVGQVRAALAASTELQAVPSNLNPPLADTMPRLTLGTSDDCFLGFFQVTQPECATGDTASSTTVALVGDSNAVMWSPGYQQIAAQQHWRLETLAKAACPLQDLPIVNPALGREYTECSRWRGQILARLRAEHPRLIVLSAMRRYGSRYGWASGFTSYDSMWIDSLARLVTQLRNTGAKVLVLGPIPDPQMSVPDCLSTHLNDAAACARRKSLAVNEKGIAAESAATHTSGGQYADLTELFCAADQCPVIVGNTLLYRDENHVTDEYARRLAPVIGALTDQALASV